MPRPNRKYDAVSVTVIVPVIRAEEIKAIAREMRERAQLDALTRQYPDQEQPDQETPKRQRIKRKRP